MIEPMSTKTMSFEYALRHMKNGGAIRQKIKGVDKELVSSEKRSKYMINKSGKCIDMYIDNKIAHRDIRMSGDQLLARNWTAVYGGNLNSIEDSMNNYNAARQSDAERQASEVNL